MPGLDRTISHDRCSPHTSALGKVIAKCAMLRPAVVPEGQRMGRPAPAKLKLGLRHMVVKEPKDRIAFTVGNAVDVRRKSPDCVQRLAAGSGFVQGADGLPLRVSSRLTATS